CRQVVRYLRGLMLAKAGALEALELTQDAAQEIKDVAAPIESREIVRALRAFGQADAALRDDPQSPLPVELALIEIAGEEPQTGQRSEPVRTSAPTALVLPRAVESANGGENAEVGIVEAEPSLTVRIAEATSGGADGGLLEQVR